jgi:hypothetical protein
MAENEGKALICPRCNGKMRDSRKCWYCGTEFYRGPEIPIDDVHVWVGLDRVPISEVNGTMSLSTSFVSPSTMTVMQSLGRPVR